MVKNTAGDICKPGGKQGIFMPFSTSERHVAFGPRVPIYFAGLIWCFIGVAIVADLFVSSIEAITNARTKVLLKSGRCISKKVWNDTVANLSLMALGSSAPEIFLSFIEIAKNKMYVGDLGPATIVGSASFNMLVIIAVCMVSIPVGEDRRIKELNAFYLSAACSLFAYLWLCWILVWNTADRIDIEEALATFVMLPVMIWVSYLIDVGDLRALFIVRYFKGSRFDDTLEPSLEALSFTDGDRLCVERPKEQEPISISLSRLDFKKAITVSYRTESFTAVPGFDYEGSEGTVTFSKGVDEMQVHLEILPNRNAHTCREFLLVVEDPYHVAGGELQIEFDPNRDGGPECAILTVAIGAHQEADHVGVCGGSCMLNTDRLRLGWLHWKEQWTTCLLVHGSWEEQADASPADWVWHVITVPWNVMFCIVPPTSFFNGWACFYGSLLYIAFITAIISDLAELLGCVLQVPDICTAITFVALGTSMPDLFASMSAAAGDPTADAAIVNVTGSNCVNVFLGLGGPWTLAAVYWSVQERVEGGEWERRFPAVAAEVVGRCVFVVEAKNLAFSVLVYAAAFVVALAILILRRKLLGAELGGPVAPKWAAFTCFILMWIGWIFIVSWRVLRYDVMDWSEQVLMIGTTSCVETSAALCALLIIVNHWRRNRHTPDTDPAPVAIQCSVSDEDAADAPFEVTQSHALGRSKTIDLRELASQSAKHTSNDGESLLPEEPEPENPPIIGTQPLKGSESTPWDFDQDNVRWTHWDFAHEHPSGALVTPEIQSRLVSHGAIPLYSDLRSINDVGVYLTCSCSQ